MRPEAKTIWDHPGYSFNAFHYSTPQFRVLYHFHEVLELTWIERGRGTRIVGDCVEPFEDGDLVLIGGGLPHLYLSDAQGASERISRACVVQFQQDFVGAQFWNVPECARMKALIDQAARGVVFSSETTTAVSEGLDALCRRKVANDLLDLLRILDILSRDTGLRVLTHGSAVSQISPVDRERIERVCRFVQNHFREPVRLEEVAREAAMSPAGFSRFFRQRTGMVFSEFLKRARLSYAATQLRETSTSVLDISLDAGFGNLSNFNRRFREHYKMTPSAYRKAGFPSQ